MPLVRLMVSVPPVGRQHASERSRSVDVSVVVPGLVGSSTVVVPLFVYELRLDVVVIVISLLNVRFAFTLPPGPTTCRAPSMVRDSDDGCCPAT